MFRTSHFLRRHLAALSLVVSSWASGQIAPGYPPTSGGSHQYEYISTATVQKINTSTAYIEVIIYLVNPTGCTTGSDCKEYDESPQFVNVWADWNGDKVFQESEQVMAEAGSGYGAIGYSGNMYFSAKATIPPLVGAGSYFRVLHGWSLNPSDPTLEGWKWGDARDFPLDINTDVACVLDASSTTGSPVLLAGEDIKFTAELAEASSSRYEILNVAWRSEGLSPGSGTPYRAAFVFGGHGKKTVNASITVKDKESGLTAVKEEVLEINVYFKKEDDDDYDDIPNWFEYWKQDQAVVDLENPIVVYDPSFAAGTVGYYDPNIDKVRVGGGAAFEHYPVRWSANGMTFGGAMGIDCLAEVLKHELRHKWATGNWNGGGIWNGMADSDFDDTGPFDFNDELPDSFEEGTVGTSKNNVDTYDLEHNKSAVYKYYGDNEYYCVLYGDGEKGIAERDWAYPGKQSNAEIAASSSSASSHESAHHASLELVGAPAFRSSLTSEENLVENRARFESGTSFGTIDSVSEVGTVDADGDSKVDAIELSIELTLNETEEYGLLLYLSDGDGNAFLSANGRFHPEDLVSGALAATIDARLIKKSGHQGPYSVKYTMLYLGDEEPFPADQRENALTLNGLPFDTLDGYAIELVDETIGVASAQEGITLTIPLVSEVSGQVDVKALFQREDSDTFLVTQALELVGGEQNLELFIPGRDLFESRYSGDLSLALLSFHSESTLGLAPVSLSDLVSIPVLYSDFQTGPLLVDDASAQVSTIDLNNDLKLEGLFVEFDISNTREGETRYQIRSKLMDRDGAVITTTRTSQLLVGGSNPIKLFYSGSTISSSGLDGPYTVGDVMLLNEGTGDVDEFVPVLIETQPYLAAEFLPASVAVAGEISQQWIDSSNPGDPGMLELTIPIDVINTGQVFTEGIIVDSNGNPIGLLSGRQILEAEGSTTLTVLVSEQELLDQNASGPVFLRDWILYHSGDPQNRIRIADSDLQLEYSPPEFSKVSMRIVKASQDGTTEVAINLAPGKTYRIDYSYDLTNWELALDNLVDTGATTTWTSPAALFNGNSRLFFRLVDLAKE